MLSIVGKLYPVKFKGIENSQNDNYYEIKI